MLKIKTKKEYLIMPSKRKKGQTLNEFVLTEMEKYHIEKNSKNVKNMRNKVNYLLKSDPKLKKLKVQRDKATKNNHNEKILPTNYWQKISSSQSFQNYAKKHVNPDYIKGLSAIDKILNDSSEDFLEWLNSKEKGLDIKNLVDSTELSNLMIRAIFEKLYPNAEINKKLLNFDLNLIKLTHDPKNFPKTYEEDAEKAFMRQQDPVKYYLKKKKA